MPESLKPDVTAFQISTDMQLELADNQTCALTPGDVLFRTTSTPDANNKLQVAVVGSKPGDCDMSTTASVPVATLEEINNSFNQQLDQGMAVLAKQGKGPFPPALFDHLRWTIERLRLCLLSSFLLAQALVFVITSYAAQRDIRPHF